MTHAEGGTLSKHWPITKSVETCYTLFVILWKTEHSDGCLELSYWEKLTENGLVQGALMSVTPFLVALVDIVKQVQEPLEIIGYADDCAIYTSDQETAQTNIQSALKNKRFHDIAGKTIDSHAHMQEKKQRPPRPTNQIE
jgi:hypothetical protein